MATLPIPDVNQAVANFLKYFESLFRLPFISDIEMERLFGAGVTAALKGLEAYNRRARLCRDCQSHCCQLVDCEFYDSGFSRCPIYAWRPLLCRMHYCHQFTLVHREPVKAIGDVFLESLLAAEKLNRPKALLLDSPPLARVAPRLMTAVSPLLTAFKESRLDEPSTLTAINFELQKYHIETTITIT